MIKISQEIQVTNLLNELIAATKVIPKFRVSGSLRYRLSHTRRTRRWCTEREKKFLTKIRRDFQVTHLHHTTQRSVCYTLIRNLGSHSFSE